MPVTFVCLNPHKNKRRWMQMMLSAAGVVKFINAVPLGFIHYAESDTRAALALATATKQPRSAIARRAKLWLLRRQYAGSRAYFARDPNLVAVAWNGLNGTRRVFMDAAKDAGNKTLFFELAPFANRITIDPRGVNFANSLPRDQAPYVTWASKHVKDPEHWHKLRDTITQRKSRAVADRTDANLPLTAPFIFVPLQVPGDSQLRIYGGAFKTVELFVDAILEASVHCPKGWHIRIKEHPSAAPFVRDAIDKSGVSNVVLDNTTDTFEQVKKAKLILTVNSSVGLEAMFFDKPVAACGDCFWAIDGIAAKATTLKDIERIMADPESVTYDTAARHAFLNYVDKCYYPELSAPANAAIIERISGPDDNGFWDAQTARNADDLV
ncbi:capsular biosynthesis protein [Loktanella sp. PT4BL]|uniref:capsular polysaccharide export protein, LipB/KpsS family n=1 Tax=Loktanella sp. PT4BL TaxID=2135611 RepID=UPI000D76A077|nr:capsular biosynthesis protein [Loktanella sp. PT4BL]